MKQLFAASRNDNHGPASNSLSSSGGEGRGEEADHSYRAEYASRPTNETLSLTLSPQAGRGYSPASLVGGVKGRPQLLNLWPAPLSLGLLLLAGCASPSSKPAAPATAAGASTTAAATAAPAAPKTVLPPTAATPPAPFEGEGWQSLFDGKTLAGWRETDFTGHGEVQCQSGAIILNMGDPFTGINYTNDFPKMNYEVALDAMRVMGSDFFCGLTVPVGDSFCSLIVGGWGGSLLGISSLDGMDASENETTKFVNFEQGRWYRIRLRVTEHRLEAWIDQEKLVNVDTTGRRISLRPGDIELSKPFGLASWQTTAALREIKLRRLP